MSASRHLHPGQLSMFLPAGHLADPEKIQHLDAEGMGGIDRMKRVKLQEAKQKQGSYSLHSSIREHGVLSAVNLYPPGEYRWIPTTKPSVVNGHHRIFSAADLDPKLEIPVKWGPQ